jgi:hypothetical protein
MIRIVNLINGEQIIGHVEESTDSYKIVDPFYIVDAINNEGSIGSKLTNVLTFSSTEYIVINKNKIVFDFPVSKHMCMYYERLVSLHDKKMAEEVVNEAINEMNHAEERYQKLMNMIRPDKSKLN